MDTVCSCAVSCVPGVCVIPKVLYAILLPLKAGFLLAWNHQLVRLAWLPRNPRFPPVPTFLTPSNINTPGFLCVRRGLKLKPHAVKAGASPTELPFRPRGVFFNLWRNHCEGPRDAHSLLWKVMFLFLPW